MQNIELTDSVSKQSSNNKMPLRTAVFNQKHGLGYTQELVSDDEVKVKWLESDTTTILPVSRLEIVKGTDNDLAVDVRVFSVSRLKEIQAKLANIKDVKKKGSPSKKIDEQAVADKIIAAMEAGEKVSITNLMKGA